MRILITGGYGFIGGRLGQHLYHTGHQVILGSRNTSSPPDWLPQAKIARIDWNDGRALEQICCGVDVVIQAAGMNAQDCAADPVAALEFNGLATARLVCAASRAGVKRFIYLSTAHVYSSPLVGTITENTCPRNQHAYATTHLAGENAVLSASLHGEIEGIVLRLSNAFGVPAHRDVNCWMLLINNLCRQAAETGNMVLHTCGLQQRDFVSMAEVCRLIEALSTRVFNVEIPQILNIGSGVSNTLLETAQLIQKNYKLVLGKTPRIQVAELKINDMHHQTLIYRTDALVKMGFQVETDNTDEIERLIHFCQTSFAKH